MSKNQLFLAIFNNAKLLRIDYNAFDAKINLNVLCIKLPAKNGLELITMRQIMSSEP